jgi:hypothetical protein
MFFYFLYKHIKIIKKYLKLYKLDFVLDKKYFKKQKLLRMFPLSSTEKPNFMGKKLYIQFP